MWIHNTDLGRRSPGGDRVLCREYAPSRHIIGGARGVVVIAVGNEHGDTSSNPGRD